MAVDTYDFDRIATTEVCGARIAVDHNDHGLDDVSVHPTLPSTAMDAAVFARDGSIPLPIGKGDFMTIDQNRSVPPLADG